MITPITQGRISFRRSLPGESSSAFEGFVAYRDLGGQRSFTEVSQMVGVTPQTVSTWASRYRWRERVKIYDDVMSHAAAQLMEANMLAEMKRNFEERKRKRLKMVDDLRALTEDAILAMGAQDFRDKPNALINILKYIDATENDLFAQVRGGENHAEEKPAVDLENLSDEQLEQLYNLADSVSGGQGGTGGGEGEAEAADIPPGSVASLQSGYSVPE